VTDDHAMVFLASASPRRRELLEQIGIAVTTCAVDIDESYIPGEGIEDFVRRLALEKAKCGARTVDDTQGLPVIGSDTIVVIDNDILGKPTGRDHARLMLKRLSGRTHTVITAVALVTERAVSDAVSVSKVTFAALDDHDIDLYLSTGEADDKAGSYAIQGIGGQFIQKLEGSYSGVMGLPLYETRQLLLQVGINPLQKQ
jgi:septum formation protein